MRGVYAIVDVDALGAAAVDAVAFASAVISAAPCALQLRAKSMTTPARIEQARALAPLCREARVPLFMNDDVDAALASGCDGVHVGQGDASIDEVRALAPRLAVGVSTHSPDQIATALLYRPSYVAYGPVFTTPSKRDHEPVVGLDGLAVASRLASEARVPLVAIGGIDVARARAIAPLVDCVAVIGALVPVRGDAAGVRARMSELRAALDDGRGEGAPRL